MLVVPLLPSCSETEDTEPFVPATEGARQPPGGGAREGEEAACSDLREATLDAYQRLGCGQPMLADCPAFIRPAGGSGCYEYEQASVGACQKAYAEAASCRELSLCLPTAVLDTRLVSCELSGAGGAAAGGSGGEAPVGGASAGAAGATNEAGAGGAP